MANRSSQVVAVARFHYRGEILYPHQGTLRSSIESGYRYTSVRTYCNRAILAMSRELYSSHLHERVV